MTPIELIASDDHPVSNRLMLIMSGGGWPYRISVWSFKGYFCPCCNGKLADKTLTRPDEQRCERCDLTITFSRREGGVCVSSGPVIGGYEEIR